MAPVKKDERLSSLELLRIMCMFGIVSMHTFGAFYGTCSGLNVVCAVAVNSVFNMGVTIFMLISGYFGVRFSAGKMVKLELAIWFYGLVALSVQWLCHSGISVSDLVKTLFPISTRKYWYMSVYMVILLLSGYLNEMTEKLGKKRFEMLLLLLFLFFYIMPSITMSDITFDGGKGIANMLTVYLIGRYLRRYYDAPQAPAKMLRLGAVVILAEFALNLGAALILRGGYMPRGQRTTPSLSWRGPSAFLWPLKTLHFTARP